MSDHRHAAPFFQAAAGTRALHAILLHFDSHPDLTVPKTPCDCRTACKAATLNSWVCPLVATEAVSTVVWCHAPWVVTPCPLPFTVGLQLGWTRPDKGFMRLRVCEPAPPEVVARLQEYFPDQQRQNLPVLASKEDTLSMRPGTSSCMAFP